VNGDERPPELRLVPGNGPPPTTAVELDEWELGTLLEMVESRIANLAHLVSESGDGERTATLDALQELRMVLSTSLVILRRR
jgi:hypothetical protein